MVHGLGRTRNPSSVSPAKLHRPCGMLRRGRRQNPVTRSIAGDEINTATRRIGLIGDVHAEHRFLDIALEFLHGQSLDAILCTGDLADGKGSLDMCCQLLRESGAQVVAGNHDRWFLGDRLREVPEAHLRREHKDESVEYLSNLPATIVVPTVLGDVLLCHGVGKNDLRKVWPGTPRMALERSHELDGIIAAGTTPLVLNGHMHYRVIVNFEGLTLINAGTLKGVHRPGVSILDLQNDVATAYEFTPAGSLAVARDQYIRKSDDRRVWRDTQCFDGQWDPVTLYAS